MLCECAVRACCVHVYVLCLRTVLGMRVSRRAGHGIDACMRLCFTYHVRLQIASCAASVVTSSRSQRGAAPAALVQPKALGAELSWLMDAAAASELSLFKSMRSLVDR